MYLTKEGAPMDVHRLEILCKVVELKSFTKAAEALSLSQPTVSEHIRSLEASLGQKLLDRFKGEITPTPVGRVFYQYARNMVHMRDEALEAVNQFQGRLGGALVVGASTIPGTYLVPRLIGSFKSNHPEAQLELKISDTAQTVEAVAEGSLEVGLVGARLNNRKVIFEELVSDELVLAVVPGHRWTAKKLIRLDELSEEPFICRAKGSGTLHVTYQILEQHGFNLGQMQVAAKMDTTESVRQGVKAGMGVSILSSKAIQDDLLQGTLIRVEVAGVHFPRNLHLVSKKNRQPSPLADAFVKHLREIPKAEALVSDQVGSRNPSTGPRR